MSVGIDRRGLILAGGAGTRLYPLTQSVSKQLMAVYDKPMVYYPLSTLMLAGIRDLLMITTPRDQAAFQHLLGDGSQWGMRLSYAVQAQPGGLADALLIGERFLAGQSSCLILGDNLYHGEGLSHRLQAASRCAKGATVFAYQVRDPERYGVVHFDAAGRVLDLQEKPSRPKSNYAVTGLYFYDADAVALARSLRPSARGELEIIDLNNAYLRRGDLRVERLGRGDVWLDAGTHESLLDAANFVHVMQTRQGVQIACPEEIAWRQGWIDDAQLQEQADRLASSLYGRYLLALLDTDRGGLNGARA